MSVEWSLPAAQEVIATAVAQRDMVIWRDRRVSYGQMLERSVALAHFLRARGLGSVVERDGLARWECGQDRVAIVMYNRPEYIESMLGSFRARAVPFNVNHHYRARELSALFEMMRPAAVIYQRSLGPRLSQLSVPLPALLVEVFDDSGAATVAGSVPFEQAVATPGRAGDLPPACPDDLAIVCTGGTTGAPKGVLWRQGDLFVSGMGGAEGVTPEELGSTAVASEARYLAGSPLMHVAAQWTAFAGFHAGASVVLHDDAVAFDARRLLEAAERHRVTMMTIVGDAFARPMIEELRRRRYDLSHLRMVGTGGATTSRHLKDELLALLPQIIVADGYGASEAGAMASAVTSTSGATTVFSTRSPAGVLSADRSRFLQPGDDEVGWVARRGRVPLGYLNDPEATAATFPVVDGERVAVPGDRARVEPAGFTLLGRDAMVVNTGGEKVFVEEVELALRGHPGVVDALVVGRASDRFGQEVVAVVQAGADPGLTLEELREHCGRDLAPFKLPRVLVVVDEIVRHASGKPDYTWARTVAGAALAGEPAGG